MIKVLTESPIIIPPNNVAKRGRPPLSTKRTSSRNEAQELHLAFGNALLATEVSDPDGRHSDTRRAIEVGVRWLLEKRRCLSSEVRLPSNRVADLVVLCPGDKFWIVEIKSSIDDFRTDLKWKDYRRYCDRLFFAITPNMRRRDIFPDNAGLIVANLQDAKIIRNAPPHPLRASNRKLMIDHFKTAHEIQNRKRGLSVNQEREDV